MPSSAHERERISRDVLALLLLCAGSIALGEATILLRPERVLSDVFLIGDPGVGLWVTKRLAHGDLLYRDVAYQYGPVSAYLYAAFAAVFGNVIRTVVLWFQVFSVASAVLVYGALRRHVSCATALVVTAVTVPIMQHPGGVLGSYLWAVCLPLERVCLLGVVWLWVPPGRRSARRALALGVVLGLWQGVKFGGGLVAGAALVAVDCAALLRWHRERGALLRWLRSGMLTAAGLLAVETTYVALALALLPADVARDTLWPMYVTEAYRAMTGPVRLTALLLLWPSRGWRVLAANQLDLLAPVVCTLGAAAAVATGRRNAEGREAALALFVAPAFFVLGGVQYFGHLLLFLIWWWALALPAAWLVDTGGRWGRLGYAALGAPGLVFLVAGAFGPRAANLVPLALPDGERVVASRDRAEEIAQVVSVLKPPEAAAHDGADQFMVFPGSWSTAAGLLALYDVPLRLRAYWYLPGFVRPYDEAEIRRSLGEIRALVVFAARDRPPPDPCTWVPGVFSPGLCADLAAHLDPEPTRVGQRWWVFRVRGAAPGA